MLFNMASVHLLEFEKFRFFWSNFHARKGTCTKFHRNRIIHGSDMEIELFSKWRPSAIVNWRKLPFWSHDQQLHVILHIRSEFRANRPITRRDITKKRFSIWRLSAILNVKNFDFCQIYILGMEICINEPNLIEIG